MLNRFSRSTRVAAFGALCSSFACAQVNQAWFDVYDGPEADIDMCMDIARDSAGYIVVAGSTAGDDSSFDTDFLTIKYDPDGFLVWAAFHAGAAGFQDDARAVAIDSQNNIYVTGRSSGGTTNDDYLTIKYSPDGIEQWARRYNNDDLNGFDVAYDVAVDSQDNIVVTGYSVSETGLSDYYTIKYDTNGQTLWSMRYDSGDDSPQIAQVLTIDALDNVYVSGGGCAGLLCTDFDYQTVKYDAAGVEQWVATYAGPGGNEDMVYGIAVDAAGTVYVTGRSFGESGTFDYATTQIHADGSDGWARRYSTPGSGEDQATALAIDAAGDVYVTGYSALTDESTYDVVTIKYAGSDGTELWFDRYDGPNQGHDIALALALDADGLPVVTGQSEEDYLTLKYDNAGDPLWVRTFAGPEGTTDTARALVVDSQGRVTITGHLGTGSPLMDAATVRYAPACPGDVNGDGVVDLSDLAILLSHFGDSGADPSDGDLNDDGNVDLTDLALLLSLFGTSC